MQCNSMKANCVYIHKYIINLITSGRIFLCVNKNEQKVNKNVFYSLSSLKCSSIFNIHFYEEYCKLKTLTWIIINSINHRYIFISICPYYFFTCIESMKKCLFLCISLNMVITTIPLFGYNAQLRNGSINYYK